MRDQHLRDHPFTSEDLALCNGVLDDVSRQFDVATEQKTAARLSSITIELFRQGVPDPEMRRMLIAATRETDN
jgi:hypothetical protein